MKGQKVTRAPQGHLLIEDPSGMKTRISMKGKVVGLVQESGWDDKRNHIFLDPDDIKLLLQELHDDKWIDTLPTVLKD